MPGNIMKYLRDVFEVRGFLVLHTSAIDGEFQVQKPFSSISNHCAWRFIQLLTCTFLAEFYREE